MYVSRPSGLNLMDSPQAFTHVFEAGETLIFKYDEITYERKIPGAGSNAGPFASKLTRWSSRRPEVTSELLNNLKSSNPIGEPLFEYDVLDANGKYVPAAGVQNAELVSINMKMPAFRVPDGNNPSPTGETTLSSRIRFLPQTPPEIDLSQADDSYSEARPVKFYDYGDEVVGFFGSHYKYPMNYPDVNLRGKTHGGVFITNHFGSVKRDSYGFPLFIDIEKQVGHGFKPAGMTFGRPGSRYGMDRVLFVSSFDVDKNVNDGGVVRIDPVISGGSVDWVYGRIAANSPVKLIIAQTDGRPGGQMDGIAFGADDRLYIGTFWHSAIFRSQYNPSTKKWAALNKNNPLILFRSNIPFTWNGGYSIRELILGPDNHIYVTLNRSSNYTLNQTIYNQMKDSQAQKVLYVPRYGNLPRTLASHLIYNMDRYPSTDLGNNVGRWPHFLLKANNSSFPAGEWGNLMGRTDDTGQVNIAGVGNRSIRNISGYQMHLFLCNSVLARLTYDSGQDDYPPAGRLQMVAYNVPSLRKMVFKDGNLFLASRQFRPVQTENHVEFVNGSAQQGFHPGPYIPITAFGSSDPVNAEGRIFKISKEELIRFNDPTKNPYPINMATDPLTKEITSVARSMNEGHGYPTGLTYRDRVPFGPDLSAYVKGLELHNAEGLAVVPRYNYLAVVSRVNKRLIVLAGSKASEIGLIQTGPTLEDDLPIIRVAQ